MALGQRNRNYLSRMLDVLLTGLASWQLVVWNGTKFVNTVYATLNGTTGALTLGGNGDGDPAGSVTVRSQLGSASFTLDGTGKGQLNLSGSVTLQSGAANTLELGSASTRDKLNIYDQITSSVATTATIALSARVVGDTNNRLEILGSGAIGFGTGSASITRSIGLSSSDLALTGFNGLVTPRLMCDVFRTNDGSANNWVLRTGTNPNYEVAFGSASFNKVTFECGNAKTGFEFLGTSPVRLNGNLSFSGDTGITRTAAGTLQLTGNGSTITFICQNNAQITLNRSGGNGNITFQNSGSSGTICRFNGNLANNSLTMTDSGGSTIYYDFGPALLALRDTINISVGTTTGTKIGTATNQKLGFFNATPIVQPALPAALPTDGSATNAQICTAINAIRTQQLNLGLGA